MEEGITISDFVTSKQIKVDEIEEKFQLEKQMDIDMTHRTTVGCVSCGDLLNQYPAKSEAWTSVTYCIACNRLILTIFSDRMGGVALDTVFVYKQKESK